MPDKTNIGWTDATWNAATGCFEVSPGCAHCYAKTFAERWRGTAGHPYEQGFDLRLWPERLDQPLRWTKPRMVFVNSMSDVFYEEIPDDFIAKQYAVMSLATWHVFQVLTKRPERMRDLLSSREFVKLVDDERERLRPGCGDFVWPLPNAWMGVSIENRRFVARADVLRATPAAVRFISAEPLLGPLVPALMLHVIDWLIVGGESGSGARPMDERWARDLVADARVTGTAVFMKQMGAVWAHQHHGRGKGEDALTFPEDLRVREFPAGLPALELPKGPELEPRLF